MKKTLMSAVSLAAAMMSPAVLAEDGQRIISAGSTATEIIYALGIEDNLVAVDFTSRHQIEGSDIPMIGYHRQLSAEGLLSLAPDMIIGSNEMGPESTLTTLSNAGVNIEVVSTGNDGHDLAGRIDEIARLTGTTERAETLKNSVSQRIEQLERQQPDTPPRAMFVMLAEGRPMTVAGNNTPIDTIISLAGGENPANTQFDSYKPMSIESIIETQPDFILVAERSWDSMGGIEGIMQKIPLLAATPAGSQQNILPVRSAAIINGFGLQSLELAENLHHHFTSGNGK